MTPAEIDRVFGRGRLRMTTGEHVEVFREEAREGEERRYTKRFLETANGDFRPWTEREWRILDRLGARGDAAVARVVRFFPADDTGMPRLQTRDAGPTVDQWATLVPLRRTAPVLPFAFGDCANWWALARQCLIALEPLHALGFVHLDFKADNVCVPWKPAQAARPIAGQQMTPDFDGLALIDVAHSLLPGVDLPGALPLAREPGFEYQSPRLLEALDEGRRGELRRTLELDWRCDLFSLAAMLWRYLPEIDDAAGTGWTRERHEAATRFVRQLLEVHGAPLAAARPHRALIGEAALWLAEPQLAAALQAGSSFDPERSWPNGAEAMPLTRVAATSIASRPVRIEPEFAAPRSAAATSSWAATTPAAAGEGIASAPIVASAAMAPPVVDDEVTVPIGAAVDVPLDVKLDEVDVPIDVPFEAPAPRAVDGSIAAPAARAVDAAGEAHGTDVAFAAPLARADDAALAHAFDAAEATDVADAPSAALASAVSGATAATVAREHATATVTGRSPGDVDEEPPLEPAWPTFADDEPPAAAAPARTTELPRLPAPSSVPILAAAGAGAIVVALAAWWQLDGRARFDRGAERAAAPASPSVVVPVPPETVAAERSVTPASADAVPQTADVAAAPEASSATAEPTASSAPTTSASPPVVAAENDRPDERGAAAAELEASAAAWMRERLPRLAQAAERRLAPVLAAAARSPELRRRTEVRNAAQAARVAVAPPAGVTLRSGEAQRLNEEALAAARRDDGVADALRLQTQAFGANPLDSAIAGDLALLHLREASPQAEPARQLALHALTLKDDRFPTGRLEDWTTLAIAAALTGREADARHAWFVSMALASDLQQQCDAALHAQATYGARVRPSVQAMLQRARSSAAYGRCEVPQAAPTEKRTRSNVKSKSTHKPRRPIP